MSNLFETLEALTKWCAAQRGAMLWTLFLRGTGKRQEIALVLMDHEAGNYLQQWSSPDLSDLGDQVWRWLKTREPRQ